jgi:hypothetical protein
MRIAVVIPDRGDRPDFMANCIQMVKAQSVQPVECITIDYIPKTDEVDITERYRAGYTIASAITGVDLIAFIENDDWYAPYYLEYMLDKWNEYDQPDLFGINYTIYYHLKLKKYFKFEHCQRASAMSTFIKPRMNFTWPRDHDPYTDQWLWMQPNGIKKKLVFSPGHIICVGMKHGNGKIGGRFHVDKLHRFINDDNGFLYNTLDPESYKFYTGLCFS